MDPPSGRDVRSTGWFRLLLACVSVAAVASVLASFVAERPTVSTDSAFFQHVGWYVLRGATPYVDVWDVNPPLTFGIAAALALLVGGNVLLLHVASAALTTAAATASVALTGLLGYDLTGDGAAGLAAGLVMLAVPEVYGLPPYGIRSQYYALLFGVLGLVLARRDRPFVAGASVAVAAGFWQPGVGFAPLVVGMAARRGGWPGAVTSVAGGGTVAGLVVLPFVASGALVPMVVETLVAPIYARAPSTPLARAYAVALALGYATVLLPVGLYGWARVVSNGRELWWVPAGGLVFGLQLLFVNMNGALDALPWFLFVALGVAIAVPALGGWLTHRRVLRAPRARWTVVAVIGIVVLSGPIWHLVPAAPGRSALEERHARAQPPQEPVLDADDAAVPDVRTVYWEERQPETCHYRLSWTELRWIASTGAAFGDERCGRWPDRGEG